jgi:hypothetical protein
MNLNDFPVVVQLEFSADLLPGLSGVIPSEAFSGRSEGSCAELPR